MMTGMASQIGVGAQRLQQPEAIELRHHDVGDDHVGRMRAGRGERFAAIADRVDVPPFGEQAPRVLPHVGVVVGQQHPAGVHLEIAGDLRAAPSSPSPPRRRSVGQPAQGFLHVVDRRAGSGLRWRWRDVFRRQVGGAERDRHRERAARGRAALVAISSPPWSFTSS